MIQKISRWGARFFAILQTEPGAHTSSCTMVFRGVKSAGVWLWHPPPSSAEVKERVYLYFYSHSGPSRPIVGWPLTLPSTVAVPVVTLQEPVNVREMQFSGHWASKWRHSKIRHCAVGTCAEPPAIAVRRWQVLPWSWSPHLACLSLSVVACGQKTRSFCMCATDVSSAPEHCLPSVETTSQFRRKLIVL